MTGSPEDTVSGELYEYLDDNCRDMKHDMELGAGYQLHTVKM